MAGFIWIALMANVAAVDLDYSVPVMVDFQEKKITDKLSGIATAPASFEAAAVPND